MVVFTIPGWYKSKKHPEASIFIFEQMQALVEEGDKVVVLNAQPVSFKSSDKPDKSIGYEDDHGVLTYTAEFKALYPSKLRYQHMFAFKRAINRLLDRAIKDHGRPDVLYAHFSYPAGAVASDLSKRYQIPLVVEEHFSGLMEKHVDKEMIHCVKKAVEGSKTFIAVSEGLKSSIEKMLKRKTSIKVISNMINDRFTFHEPTTHGGFVFFACGSLITRKGFSELIKAFTGEFKNDNSVALRIGGSGEQRERLEDLIKQMGMAGRVELLGQLTREDTLREYINCDCFVLASKAETYGLVYREAMAVGRPIISTMHGGFGSGDWHDEYGKLIPVDDEKALREAMRKVYENYNNYDLKGISELCLRDCSKKSVANLIHNELKMALNEE